METYSESLQYKNWRWVRSTDSWLGGVCSGLAVQFNQPVWLVRLVWFLTFWVMGFGFLLYLMCWISFPRVDQLAKSHEKMVLGVCARIGRRGDVEVGLARLIALTLLFTTFGAALVGYIVLHFVVTEESVQKIEQG